MLYIIIYFSVTTKMYIYLVYENKIHSFIHSFIHSYCCLL